jgi:hypothetical protein
LRRLARAVASGELSLEPGADPEAVREALLAIPGIGEWTVQYVALRALGEPDAFPASDLGLLRSPANGGVSGPRELLARAESWRPWRGYAAIVLWRAYSGTGAYRSLRKREHGAADGAGVAAEANATARRRVVEKERARAHSGSRSRTPVKKRTVRAAGG